MYLKSLEVHGFKSFANKLLFEFHNGITAIVGPNGSGKSNVADAVRWVLGEQRAKQLRGAKMEDVIFAGTELRRPLGYAYVAITISNDDHKLPVPYEEVKIARRVYRSGESEYLLNGASCRLKDVQELLFDTGIGKEGYSIIGQGQIDQILSGRPEERRELFDEAAGIVKYKKRKAAAEKNLEEEQQNLVRIEDILSELRKQVGPLKEQSEKAREYLAYRDELRNLDIHVFLKEYDRLQGEITEVEGKQEIAARELEEAGRELERTREEYVAVEKELEKHSQELEKMKEALNQDTLSLNQSEGDIKVLKEQINTARQSREHNVEVTASLKERIAFAKEEEEGYLVQKKELSQRMEGLRRAQSDTKSRIDDLAEQMAFLETEVEQCNKDIIALLNENTEVKAEEQRVRTLWEQNNLKKADLTRRMLENKTETGILEEVIKKEQAVLNDISDKLAALGTGIDELKNSRHVLEEQEKSLRREHRDTQQNYHMAHSRLASLKNITERYEGFGQSIRRVMEQKSEYPGIVGVVADIIRVQKEYELAVETALGGSIQNIVTDNEQTAKDMIQFLKKNRYGRATFLPLTNMRAKPVNLSGNVLSEPGVIGMASSLVTVDDRFQSLVEYLLGRFVVMDHIDNAIVLARKYHHTIRIVTKEGDLLNPGGSMSGGAFKNSNNLLGRRREMEDLEKQENKLSERLEALSADIKKNHREVQEVEARLSANRKARQEFFLQQNTAQGNYDRAVQDLQDMEEKRDLIRLESEDTRSRDDELKKEIRKIDEQLQANEAQSNERKERMAAQSEQLEKMKDEHERLSDEDSQKLLTLTAEEQKGKSIEENLERIAGELGKLAEELSEVSKSGEDAEVQVKEKESAILRTREQIAGFEKHMKALQESIEEAVAKKESLTGQHKGFFEKREALSDRQTNLDKECFRLANQREKLTEQLDSRTNYMWEQYELTYHGAEESLVPVELELSGMKSRIGELKNAMKALGDININAVDQYKEIKERYELLEGQHSDLIEAAEALMGIIEELDSSMRTQFEEQFGEIRTRFDKVFKELFGGGRGTLELTEDEDILLAGIRIVAQPPGKKLQNMMQLSGGEKALTAIALLFAIQSLKPSPFCLLDEIEAALDDSNVTRFAQYLHKLIKDTQFIVITHRRGTMNAADRLYGITMQEKGVSTLVSVNLLEEGVEGEEQQAT